MKALDVLVSTVIPVLGIHSRKSVKFIHTYMNTYEYWPVKWHTQQYCDEKNAYFHCLLSATDWQGLNVWHAHIRFDRGITAVCLALELKYLIWLFANSRRVYTLNCALHFYGYAALKNFKKYPFDYKREKWAREM